MDSEKHLAEIEKALEAVEGKLADLLEACYSTYYFAEILNDEDLRKDWEAEGMMPDTGSILDVVSNTIARINELVTTVDRLKQVAEALKKQTK